MLRSAVVDACRIVVSLVFPLVAWSGLGQIAQAQTPTSVTQTQETADYRITLEIDAASPLLTPDQAVGARVGQVLVVQPKGSVPEVSMTDQGRTVNHLLEIAIANRASGAVVSDLPPTVTFTDQASQQSRRLPGIALLYDVTEGPTDLHWGGNYYIPDGTYTIRITVGDESATFPNMLVQDGGPPAPR